MTITTSEIGAMIVQGDLDLEMPDVFGWPGRAERWPGNQSGGALTVEIEMILKSEELTVLLDTAESSGQLRQAELQEVLEPLELDPLEVDAVYIELDRRGIELVEEPEKEAPPPPLPLPAPVGSTTDALQLFLRCAGRHAL